MTEEDRTTMRVILCKPDEKAVVIEMEDSLESMQRMVGGLIQEYMPFHSETDPRSLIFNDITIEELFLIILKCSYSF